MQYELVNLRVQIKKEKIPRAGKETRPSKSCSVTVPIRWLRGEALTLEIPTLENNGSFVKFCHTNRVTNLRKKNVHVVI